MTYDGQDYLKDVIRKYGKRKNYRTTQPQPGDNDWPWWIQARLERTEDQQTWLFRIIIGAVIAQLILEIIRNL